MVWKRGTIKDYLPAWDTDVSYPALVNDGVSIHYLNDENNDRGIFVYKTDAIRFPFAASRLARDGAPTDTWIVDFHGIKRILRNSFGETFMQNNIAQVKRNIETALLADPAWPSDFGRPGLPALNVRF